MTSIELIRWMCGKQDDLNAITNRKAVAEHGLPSWKALRRRWHRAVWMEGAEMMERMPWKWWKAAPVADITQLKIELVDIFHFLLSWMIQEDFAPAGMQVAFDRARIEPVMDQELAIERMVHAASGGSHNFANARDALAVACVAFELDLPEIHRLYAGKNLLNGFRQANGYADGSYRKHWHDGREDNEHLADVIKSAGEADDADQFAALVMAGLNQRYAIRAPQ